VVRSDVSIEASAGWEAEESPGKVEPDFNFWSKARSSSFITEISGYARSSGQSDTLQLTALSFQRIWLEAKFLVRAIDILRDARSLVRYVVFVNKK
jgi:hypothetical protein